MFEEYDSSYLPNWDYDDGRDDDDNQTQVESLVSSSLKEMHFLLSCSLRHIQVEQSSSITPPRLY